MRSSRSRRPGLQLEVTVRKDSLQVGDRNSGPLASFPNKDGGYDYDGLSRYLQQVKIKVSGQDRRHHPAGTGHAVRHRGRMDRTGYWRSTPD